MAALSAETMAVVDCPLIPRSARKTLPLFCTSHSALTRAPMELTPSTSSSAGWLCASMVRRTCTEGRHRVGGQEGLAHTPHNG